MATINNEEIKNTLHYLITISNIVDKDLNHVESNRKVLDKFVPDEIKGHYTRKQNDALRFKDKISSTLYDFGVVWLTTAFEKIVFAKYRTSFGEIRSVVKDKTEKPLDYFASRERLVNDKIDKLQGIFNLIDGIIDGETMKFLNEIKEHRNHIVHGKRDSSPPENEYDLFFIAKIFDIAISEIEKN